MKTIKLTRFYSACAIFFAGLGVMVSCQAQAVPILPKEWKGEISGTSIGSNHKKANPNQFARGWNTYDEVRTLIVLRQEGRHLEMALKNPRGEVLFIGTISRDGKQIIVTDQGGLSMTLNFSGNSLSGCGATRGVEGTFDDWFNSYAALCLDLTAVK
jgi:hypothetical protein